MFRVFALIINAIAFHASKTPNLLVPLPVSTNIKTTTLEEKVLTRLRPAMHAQPFRIESNTG